MKNYITVTNQLKDKDLAVTKKISDYIISKGGTVKNFYNDSASIIADLDEIPKNCECILVLGGDGTLIRTATKLETLQIPLIGVNLGTLGYLCELEEDNVLEAIDILFEDKYMIEERMMIQGFKPGSEEKTVALNDIVIHRVFELSIIPLSVYVNGEWLTNFLADGIIVATPTGSTAYNMSAGGPMVDPKSNILLLTPINAHNLNSKSIVLESDDVIEIEIGERRSQKDERAGVSFDGDSFEELQVGERIVITKSDRFIKFCRINKRSFLDTIRKKMNTTY